MSKYLVDVEAVEHLLQERIRRARAMQIGSERSRLKMRTRENEASEILGEVRKLPYVTKPVEDIS